MARLMTLVLVVRTIEGIVVVTDTLTTANTTLEIYGETEPVEYHIYHRRKMAKIHNFAVVHAGLSFINRKTINQIVDRIPAHEISIEDCIKRIKDIFIEELEKDPIVKQWKRDQLIISIGIVGYHNDKPFVYRIIFFRNKEDDKLLDIMETETEFESDSYYGIDYFGDYEFVQLVIRAAKKENLLKPFDILTINDALDLARTLMRFLIEFQKYMVKFTVAFPIESAVITQEGGFQFVDKMETQKFHYSHDLL